MELTLIDLNYDALEEIMSWLDEPSAAVFEFVVFKKSSKPIKNFDAIYHYSPSFVRLFYNFLNTVLCKNAARAGNLELLKWAYCVKWCYWNADTCAAAAGGGHLEVLKWARENGCKWNWWTCIFAAENGHLETLKWAKENG
jgi:hypothetical protein